VTFADWLDTRAKRRAARQRLLIEHGLDTRSLIKSAIAHVDPKFLIASVIIGIFARAYVLNPDDTMKGALIAAFAGAWGYYLGSSRSASLAADRADKSLEVAQDAVKKVPTPPAPPAPPEPPTPSIEVEEAVEEVADAARDAADEITGAARPQEESP
jgi:hypothetical protein